MHLAIEVAQRRLKDDVDLCEGDDDALKILPVSHIPFLSWRCVPPDLRNCNGISSLSYDCQPGHEGCGGEGTGNHRHPLRYWKRYVNATCTALSASRVQEFLTQYPVHG